MNQHRTLYRPSPLPRLHYVAPWGGWIIRKDLTMVTRLPYVIG